jgi:tetratricopeptide (TPR) repeat protein
MTIRSTRFSVFIFPLILCLLPLVATENGRAQASQSGSGTEKQASSSTGSIQREKSPMVADPAGPTVSLISLEPVFVMAAALNACGYDDGLEESSPVRAKVREEINQALAKSEDARNKRDRVCLYIAQHRITGTERDISQYVSLSLYLTPPPQIETAVELTDMPPDSTQVAEIVPLLNDFAAAIDIHSIWLAVHPIYDHEADELHDVLTRMIVNTNLYLKMPAPTYDGRHFVVVFEPLLSPHLVNARVYGVDYIVVVSPVEEQVRIKDVRHTYLHYMIEPLLYARSNAIDRTQPIMKYIHDAPLAFVYRSDPVPLTVECLIKAIEARTMDTGVPVYKIPAGVSRSDLPRYEHEQQVYQQKVDVIKLATVHHDMTQGYVLTQYFYEELIRFEKDPASLKDTIGEMVYSMDVDQQIRRLKMFDFDKEADDDVLQRSRPRKLTGLDLAEARLASGDVAGASSLARQALGGGADTLDAAAAGARANFILARAAILSGHPEDAIDGFQKTLTASRDPRLLAWSHIYLGRMLDLDCKRDQALTEYKLALEARDGQQDTRLAAERGAKAAYAVKGHICDDDADDAPGGPEASPEAKRPVGNPFPGEPAKDGAAKPQ